MTIIDKTYRDQLEQLHQDGKFNNGRKAYRIVKSFMQEHNPNSVLDFGCGQGGLVDVIRDLHPGIQAVGYDPGNPVFAKMPEQTFSAVISTDALEHVEPAHLTETLKIIGSKIEQYGFFRIACYPAKKKLPDGRNAHLIVESPAWWRQQLLANMNITIVKEEVSVFDKSHKWAGIVGEVYDVTVEVK
jgi:cyclopropane fatty-acyl-phospholipid synthase-like methyltransferase